MILSGIEDFLTGKVNDPGPILREHARPAAQQV